MWLENVVLYQVWRKLKRIKQNQLNIKNEFFIMVVTWTISNVLAFALQDLMGQITLREDKGIRWLYSLYDFVYLSRNLVAFYS
jgi:hypothetical protein